MKKKNNKGFSLIELIIAIAILVILTGLLAPQFMRYMEKSREAKDMQSLDTIYGAVQTALAEEAAYKEVQAKTFATLTTTGVNLADIKTDAEKTGANVPSAFATEMKNTMGDMAESRLWSSKAVTDAGMNDNVWVLVNPTNLQVSVWVGNATTDGAAPTDDKVLNSGGCKIGDKTIKTVGAKFIISK